MHMLFFDNNAYTFAQQECAIDFISGHLKKGEIPS